MQLAKALEHCECHKWQITMIFAHGGALKYKMHVNNSFSLQDLKDTIEREISATSRQQLCYMPRNIFCRYTAYLEVYGWHF